MNEHLRQTGRTTRLMEKAQEIENQGRQVTLYVHNKSYQRLVEGEARRRGQTFTVDSIPYHFDWEHMRPMEYQGPNVCLVDHAAVEIELQRLDERILKMQQLARQLYHLTTV